MFRARPVSPDSGMGAESVRWRLPGWLAVALGIAAFAAGAVVQARIGLFPTVEPRPPATEPSGGTAAPAPGAQSYRGQVLRVVDGDTVEARVQTWPGQEVVTLVRLRGIDAPELSGACAQERVRAEEARDALTALIGGRSITVSEIGPDKYYGRVVARLMTSDGTDAGQALLDSGPARFYVRGQRGSWCQSGLPGIKG